MPRSCVSSKCHTFQTFGPKQFGIGHILTHTNVFKLPLTCDSFGIELETCVVVQAPRGSLHVRYRGAKLFLFEIVSKAKVTKWFGNGFVLAYFCGIVDSFIYGYSSDRS